MYYTSFSNECASAPLFMHTHKPALNIHLSMCTLSITSVTVPYVHDDGHARGSGRTGTILQSPFFATTPGESLQPSAARRRSRVRINLAKYYSDGIVFTCTCALTLMKSPLRVRAPRARVLCVCNDGMCHRWRQRYYSVVRSVAHFCGDAETRDEGTW